MRRKRTFRKKRTGLPRLIKRVILKQEETKKSIYQVNLTLTPTSAISANHPIWVIDLDHQPVSDIGLIGPAGQVLWQNYFCLGYAIKITFTNQTTAGMGTFYTTDQEIRMSVISSRFDPSDMGLVAGNATLILGTVNNFFGIYSNSEESPTTPLEMIFDRNKTKLMRNKQFHLRPSFSGEGLIKETKLWVRSNHRKRILENPVLAVDLKTLRGNSTYLLLSSTGASLNAAAAGGAQAVVTVVTYYKLA